MTELIKGQTAPILWVGVVLCGIIFHFGISVSSFFVGEASARLLITAVIFEMVVEIAGVEKGRGSGTSKSYAEHAAAQAALINLGVM